MFMCGSAHLRVRENNQTNKEQNTTEILLRQRYCLKWTSHIVRVVVWGQSKKIQPINEFRDRCEGRILCRPAWKQKNKKKLNKLEYSPKLEDCTAPVNVPIFAWRKCFFCQSTLRIYRVYTPYENVGLSLENKQKNSLKNSNYKSTTWNQNSDPPTGLWPFMEWNKLTSSSGVQTKTSSVDAILICCANTHDHFVHLLENMQSIAGSIRTSARNVGFFRTTLRKWPGKLSSPSKNWENSSNTEMQGQTTNYGTHLIDYLESQWNPAEWKYQRSLRRNWAGGFIYRVMNMKNSQSREQSFKQLVGILKY